MRESQGQRDKNSSGGTCKPNVEQEIAKGDPVSPGGTEGQRDCPGKKKKPWGKGGFMIGFSRKNGVNGGVYLN